MSLLRLIPELPLLKRELIELSNRRRTYIIRFLGAIVVLSIVMIQYQQAIEMISGGWMGMRGQVPGQTYNPNKYFGSGGLIFMSIVPMLFYCVQFLMPAMICGSISLEKERNTLGTLFVTRLTPMTIVFEKLGSRLVPMFTFLLLTFPVLAFVYSLGGVDTVVLLSTLWLLFCECLLFACIGLMCSSWFATTVTAFIWSYALTGLLVLTATMSRIPFLSPYNVWQSQFSNFAMGGGWTSFPGMAGIGAGVIPGISATGDPQWLLILRALFGMLLMSLPSLFAAGFCLLLARVFLIRRAFVSSSSVLLKLFKRVDGFFHRLNERTTGGVVLIRDRESMPLFDPVAWRERTKKSLGKARYLIRILIVIEGPILFICLIAATSMQSANFEGLRALLYFAWGLAALMLTVKASTLISAERTRETLDALLSTPLTLREILTQKIAGARRLMIVLAIPVLTVHLTLLLMHFDAASVFRNSNYGALLNILVYIVLVVAATIVMMHEVAWLSVLLGLRSSSQTRSVMTALAVLSGWAIVSLMVAQPGGLVHSMVTVGAESGRLSNFGGSYQTMSLSDDPEASYYPMIAMILCGLRPDGCIQANEGVLSASVGMRYGDHPLIQMLSAAGLVPAVVVAGMVLLWHTAMMLGFRFLALYFAPRLLNRRDEVPGALSAVELDVWQTTTLSEVPG